jgi:two-component system NtrC family sensor kinase
LVILAMAMIIGYVLLGRMVLGPVTEMIRLIRRIEKEGIADYVKRHPGATSTGELGRLQRAFFHLAGELADDRRQIQRQLFELARANDEIETANQQLVLSEKLATVGRLASGVAHEIGNPIAILQGYLEMLDDPEMKPEARAEALVIMEQALDRVGTIIRDLLDFARLERDESGTCDVVQVVRVAVKLVEPQKRFHGLEVKLDVPESAQWASIASGRLEQVLLNLLFNAADASPEGGCLTVRVVSSAPEWVDLEVADQGTGISEENLGKVFDPFFTTKDPGEGTGLGLAISHSIVQAVGGEIRVASASETGATFTVRLPRFSP